MTREELFDIWAPRNLAPAGWSDWVKPVLFAHDPQPSPAVPQLLVPSATALPELPPSAALLIDLPGDAAVWTALQLAHRGFRPVPLYNGIADGTQPSDPLAPPLAPYLGNAVINVWPILRALWSAAEILRTLPLPPDAPPAFLLDSRRRLGERSPAPGLLDNRWLSFPTDFPSARILLDRGITQAILITQTPGDPPTDLAHTLLRWQEASITLHTLSLETLTLQPCTVRRPGMFRAAWYQALTTLGLRRSLLGGFGGRVPNPSSG